MTTLTNFDKNHSIPRLLTKEKPIVVINPEDKFETMLFLPEGENRKGEGGLRTKGYFKHSYKMVDGKWFITDSDNNPVVPAPDDIQSKIKQYLSSIAQYQSPITELPLITVITVVYNGDKYLEETILSVINQTYPNVEYIIIDGGSTDGTIDIIKKYEHAIDYWVSEKDKGMYDALNKGFLVSTGRLINFCNSDDLFYSNNVIEHIVIKYNLENFDCCYGITEYIDENKDILYTRYPLNFKYRYIITLGMPFGQPTFFWTREMMKSVGLFDLNYKIASDYDLIGKILINSKKCFNTKEYIIKFRKHGNSFGDNNTDKALKETLVIKKYLANELKIGYLKSKYYLLHDRIVLKLYQLFKNIL